MILKNCSACERTFTVKQWNALHLVGVQDVIADPDEPKEKPAYDLELRNCPCGTTLAFAKCSFKDCKKLATDTHWKFHPVCTTHLKLFRKIELSKQPGPAGQQARNDLIKAKFYKLWGKRRQNSGGRIEPVGTNRRVPAKLMLEYLERSLK